jgi:hypothetical protein
MVQARCFGTALTYVSLLRAAARYRISANIYRAVRGRESSPGLPAALFRGGTLIATTVGSRACHRAPSRTA